jgi:hypothetical protein
MHGGVRLLKGTYSDMGWSSRSRLISRGYPDTVRGSICSAPGPDVVTDGISAR